MKSNLRLQRDAYSREVSWTNSTIDSNPKISIISLGEHLAPYFNHGFVAVELTSEMSTVVNVAVRSPPFWFVASAEAMCTVDAPTCVPISSTDSGFRALIK